MEAGVERLQKQGVYTVGLPEIPGGSDADFSPVKTAAEKKAPEAKGSGEGGVKGEQLGCVSGRGGVVNFRFRKIRTRRGRLSKGKIMRRTRRARLRKS